MRSIKAEFSIQHPYVTDHITPLEECRKVNRHSVQFGPYTPFGRTRNVRVAGIMLQRINAFSLLLGGLPALNQDVDESRGQSFMELALDVASRDLKLPNRRLGMIGNWSRRIRRA